jgi:predicted transcriptional regulator
MATFKTSTQQMLEAVRAEKNQLKERLAQLEEREKTILGWQAEEEPQQELPMDGRPKLRLKTKLSLDGFLREAIKDRKPRSNEELAELGKLRGVLEGHVDLRSVHATMMSFMNAGLVKRENEKWVAV